MKERDAAMSQIDVMYGKIEQQKKQQQMELARWNQDNSGTLLASNMHSAITNLSPNRPQLAQGMGAQRPQHAQEAFDSCKYARACMFVQ